MKIRRQAGRRKRKKYNDFEAGGRWEKAEKILRKKALWHPLPGSEIA